MSRPGLFTRAIGWLEDVAAGGKLDPEAPAPPAREEPADPARVAAWRSLLAVAERLKKYEGCAASKVEGQRCNTADMRWCGREVARCARALWTTSDRLGIAAAEGQEIGVRMRDAFEAATAGEPVEIAAREEAESLRAKEAADHAAWLRENAASVVLPEHPAVALLRKMEWSINGLCPECRGEGPDKRPTSTGSHRLTCALAAILASSKPGERALADLLAEEREAGRREGLAMRDDNAQNLVDNLRKTHAREVDEARELGRREQREQHARNLRALEAESQQVLGARLAEERAKGAAEEREACAKVAESPLQLGATSFRPKTPQEIVILIRARGQS